MSPRLATASPASIETCAPAGRRRRRGCERPATPGRATLGRLGIALTLALLAVACGGKSKGRGDTYVAATSAQERCCEHLAGAGRDRCLAEIVRVQDEAVARSADNQATYACVQDHFVCNPATGTATQESAQAQLDCIQDLPAR
ncbi:MAG: hypothetical protein HS111_38385 [Kofleriaceae bacterium]|nr:hypothetical protein [Kofleriaceae bacterium]